MKFFNGFDAERMFPLKEFQKRNAEGPDIQCFGLNHFLFLNVKYEFRSCVPLGSDELVCYLDFV